MNQQHLTGEIIRLREEKNILILAHYYTLPGVQEVAHFVGDSLELCRRAFLWKGDTILFAGVDFMGESAKLLCPEKRVLIPEEDASCPMAHMASIYKIRKMREEISDLAVVCYINSTASIKAESDVCVTSSNAVEVVSKMPQQNIYFIPDVNLGRYVASHVPQKQFYFGDGVEVLSGQVVAILHGNLRALLSGERTALNFLQRMTGIATMTKEWSALLEGTGTRLIDTRKTTPNMRVLEKYAVRIGGGQNHRSGLSDGILIKDNHIAAAGSIGNAVSRARKANSFQRKIEVEVESLEMVKEALAAGADIIMLDNMEMSLMKEAIGMIGGRALTECSGNVTKKRVQELADLGLDFISCGALTHSARICDFSMKHLRRVENL